MISLITAAVGSIFGLAGDWFEGKRKKAERADRLEEAKVQARIDMAKSDMAHEQNWDIIMAQGSQDSWKDEFWTILLAIPIVLLFWPNPEINEIAEKGFIRMAEAPDWYVTLMLVAVSAAFGVRKIIEFIDKFKGLRR